MNFYRKSVFLLCWCIATKLTLASGPTGPGTIFSPEVEQWITARQDLSLKDPVAKAADRTKAVDAFLATPESAAELKKIFPDKVVFTKGTKTDLPPIHNNLRKNFQTSVLPNAMSGPDSVTIANYIPASLFPDHSDLATNLTAFIARLEADKSFVSKFTKLHFFILHEIYVYLIKVYTTFNLTRISTMDELLANESKTTGAALNKKTLIVTHMFSLIEAQIHEFIKHQWPTLPNKYATTIGTVFNKTDYGSNYEDMFRDFERDFAAKDFFPFDDSTWQAGFKTMQSNYLTTFGMYLAFTKSYTNSLSEKNPDTGLNEFIGHARTIKTQIDNMLNDLEHPAKLASLNTSYAKLTTQIAANKAELTKTVSDISDAATYSTMQPTTNEIIETIRTMKKLRPPLFFYNETTLRGIKIIPHLAESIPPNSTKIPYPAKLLEQVKNGTQIKTGAGNIWTDSTGKPHFVAEFFNSDGISQMGTLSPTDIASPSYKLVVNIPQWDGKVYRQQILPQPDWLNSVNGIMSMLRACLGDFSVLLRDDIFKDEIIFDPFIASIICKAAATQGGLGISTAVGDAAKTAAQGFIDSLNPPIDEGPPPG